MSWMPAEINHGIHGKHGIFSAANERGEFKERVAVEAAKKKEPSGTVLSQELAGILRPQAAYRWLLPALAALTPKYIEMVLRGALAGNHVQAWELFDLMEDTWPRLVKNANQLKLEVVEELKAWRVRPCQEDEEPPTDSAQERARLVNAALRTMRPRAEADENDLGGTIYDLLDGWLKGQVVLETMWEVRSAGKLGKIVAPRATYWVHPTCVAWTRQGRLGLRLELMKQTDQTDRSDRRQLTPGVWQSTSWQPRPLEVAAFPRDKFLIGIHRAKSGTALGAALLRSLAWWWCAANFTADWLLNQAQLFGLPFRWASYSKNAPQEEVARICTMLENMGSAGWAAFPAGTQLELKGESGKTGSQSPQGDLLDRADRNCDLLILGQTLTSDVSQSAGSRAQGEVHERVEARLMRAAAGYAASVFNAQLIPSILRLNYGDENDLPRFESEEEEAGTLQFKREVFKGFMGDGTICDLLANQTDLKQLVRDVKLPVNEEYVEPYVPVSAETGLVSGRPIKDEEGDIVGGDVIKANFSTNGNPNPSRMTNDRSPSGNDQ